MCTCTTLFQNFSNRSGVNTVDICDVTFIGGGGGGHIFVTICDQGARRGSKKFKSVMTSLMDSP